MSIEERQQRFLELVNEATRLTGIRVTADTAIRALIAENGAKINQIEAVIMLASVPDWTPPAQA